MEREDRFSGVGGNAFAYVAHPPIIVSTLACTAMIEEIGAEYINQFVSGKSVDLNKTRASDILETLADEFPNHPDFDISAIDETIVTARHDIAHYLRKRPEAVTVENHEEHMAQGLASIRLVGMLADQLLTQVVQDYRNRVLQEIVKR